MAERMPHVSPKDGSARPSPLPRYSRRPVPAESNELVSKKTPSEVPYSKECISPLQDAGRGIFGAHQWSVPKLFGKDGRDSRCVCTSTIQHEWAKGLVMRQSAYRLRKDWWRSWWQVSTAYHRSTPKGVPELPASSSIEVKHRLMRLCQAARSASLLNSMPPQRVSSRCKVV